MKRIGSLFERANAAETRRPSWDEIEAVLMEGYARALEMERERSAIERRTSLLVMAANGQQVAELRVLGARHTELDRNVRWLRSLLVELREYGATLRPSQPSIKKTRTNRFSRLHWDPVHGWTRSG